MALNFAASGDKLTTATFVVPTQITYAAWVKDPPFANGGPRIFENTTPTTRFFFGSDGTLIYQRLFSVTQEWQVSPANLGSPDWTQWHHVAVSHDASSNANDPVFYLDGQVKTISSFPASRSGSVNTTTNVMNIGNRPSNGRYSGWLEYVGIYNAVLSQANVQSMLSNAHYASNRFANWTLSPDGATFADISASGLTATKAGAPVFGSGPTLSSGGIEFAPSPIATLLFAPILGIPVNMNFAGTIGAAFEVASGTPYAGGPGAGVGGLSKGKLLMLSRRRGRR